ncbi:MAG: hypothetical protein OXH57_11775, partial [Ekhidna sp.]|nr:hypothetical protein [Ekhidna sp.]
IRNVCASLRVLCGKKNLSERSLFLNLSYLCDDLSFIIKHGLRINDGGAPTAGLLFLISSIGVVCNPVRDFQ